MGHAILPVDYEIFADPTLVYIRYYGHVKTAEIMDALTRFASSYAHLAGQTHFFDFSKITSYEVDYPLFFKFMAKLTDIYPAEVGQQLNVFFAPPGPPAEMAEMARNPWEGSDKILIRTAQTQEQAFEILGWPRPDVVAHMEAHA
ncbi:hypothetical protein [Octadecabacter ascidiaceicola]|nr:hypothetical protein [Octadecabacter ascidiaceicola]